MTKGQNKRPHVKHVPHCTGRRPPGTALLVCAAALCALALAWSFWGWYSAPAPPAVSFAETDPAVVEAIEGARRTVWRSPRSAPAWGRLGQLLRAHNYLAESNVCFTQAERLDPGDPRWPYVQGLNLQRDDPEAAIRHLQRAVRLCGSVPDAPELCLAELYLQQGRLQEAQRHFEHVLKTDPLNARAHLGLGRLAYERGDPTESVAHLNRAAASRLTQKAAAVLLAQAYHQLGDASAASQARARATDLPNDPPWPDPYMEEIQSLTIGKQFRLARLQALQQQGRVAEVPPFAAKLEEDYPDVYCLVEGRQQMDKGNLEAAEQALRKATELAPDSVDAYFDLGTVLLRQKQYRAAGECFERVTKLVTNYGPAYQQLGYCWQMQGNRAEAIRAFQAAVHYMPENADAHRDLGSLLLEDGQAVEARTHLRQALQLQPGDDRAKQLLEEIAKRAP